LRSVASSRDPYAVLGVAPNTSDAEVRASYRRLVQLHHPDHNGGSPESASRFEEVQAAYAEIRRLRQSRGAAGSGSSRRRPRTQGGGAGARPPDPNLDGRLAEMERQLREANLVRERARRAAHEAAAAAEAQRRPRASDDELGYVETDDSLMKILSDAREELFGKASEVGDEVRGQGHDEVHERRVADRAADVLEDLAARLRGERPGSRDERS
jgi:curved DNA-binding protein CbpA